MAEDGESVKLQSPSEGIEFDNYQGNYITCTYQQEGVSQKEETYIFRCSADKSCCGRVCCVPAAAGIPLWLLILILVLVFLLALLLLAGIIYYCWKYCRRKHVYVEKPVVVQRQLPATAKSKVQPTKGRKGKREVITVLTDLESSVDNTREPSTEPVSSVDHDLETLPPSQPSTVTEGRVDVKTRRFLAGKEPPPMFVPSHMEETFESPPTPIPISYHEESEISAEKRPLMNKLDRPEEQKAQMMYYRPFVPSPMEETTLPPPFRSQASFHHSSEFTKEQHAVVTHVDLGEQKKPQLMYTRPGKDKVASY